MKRFLLKVFFFVLGMAALLAVPDWCISKHFYASRSAVLGSWNDIIQGRAETEVLVLGNSRAIVQYSPFILDSVLGKSVYVLGVNGSPMNRQVAQYRLYRHYYPKPKMIICNVDKGLLTPKTRFQEVRYFPYFWNPAVRKLVMPEEQFSFAEKYVPMYRYTHYGIRNLVDDTRLCKRGYHASEKHFEGLAGIEKATLESVSTISDDQAEIFDAFVDEVLSEGIELVFVYAPFCVGIEEHYGIDPWGKSFFDSVALKYGVEMLDFSNDSICLDTANFYNYTHMNRTGSEQFSRKLACQMNEEIFGRVKNEK